MRSDVTLTIDNQRYGGWTKIRIRRSIKELAGSFELTVSSRWAEQSTPRPITPGATCTLQINDQTVISGYVDLVAPEYDAKTHLITVVGRDKTGDLVDCAAAHKTGQWKKQTLLQIASDLCQPFGIDVVDKAGAGRPFNSWSFDTGELVFENLERAARHRAVLLLSDGMGTLEIARAGTEKLSTALMLGENILSAKGRFSWAKRFSRYQVTGQQQGSDMGFGAVANEPMGESVDKAINRYRPLVVVADDSVDITAANEMAIWERNVRMSQGTAVTYTVQGWYHSNGLWQPNVMVPVRDPRMGIDMDLLISSVTYLLDEKGIRAELEVTRREAFDLVDIPEEKKGLQW